MPALPEQEETEILQQAYGDKLPYGKTGPLDLLLLQQLDIQYMFDHL